MLHGFLVSAAGINGELAGALVELRGHGGGFFRRTTEGDEDLGEFGNFHGGQLYQIQGTKQHQISSGLLDCWTDGWVTSGMGATQQANRLSIPPFVCPSSRTRWQGFF
jgi:hypothetical protein